MQTVDEKLISDAAYYLWLARGCPDGTEIENWLEAERILADMVNFEYGLSSEYGLRELRLRCGLREYALGLRELRHHQDHEGVSACPR